MGALYRDNFCLENQAKGEPLDLREAENHKNHENQRATRTREPRKQREPREQESHENLRTTRTRKSRKLGDYFHLDFLCGVNVTSVVRFLHGGKVEFFSITQPRQYRFVSMSQIQPRPEVSWRSRSLSIHLLVAIHVCLAQCHFF